MSVPTESLIFDRWIARLGIPRRRAVIAVGIVLILIPCIVLWVELGTEMFSSIVFRDGRQLFFYPVMITFLLAVIGPVLRTRDDVAHALRPLAQVDDETFASAVSQALQIRPIGEVVAFAAGVAFTFALESLVGPQGGNPEYPVASRYIALAWRPMFGVIGWSIFVSFTVTRHTNTLLRLPMKIDIFDTAKLAPIGRQSLYLALVFVGAILLSLFFVVAPERAREFISLENAVIYGILITLTISVFLVNMHRTHSLLAAERTAQLSLVERNLAHAYYDLQGAIAGGEDTLAAATEVNALSASKRELRQTRTWPYNTEMLRTLAISILTPLALGLARVLAPLLANRPP